jgi:hypothetical protein
MTETDALPFIERLHLEPGDILVLSYPTRLTAETAYRIQEQVRTRLGAIVPVVVLDSGGRLQIVNKSELEKS